MKGTDFEQDIPALFRGRYWTTWRGKNISFEASRTEDFYDLSLVLANFLENRIVKHRIR
jgi:hypothetical protein